MTHRQRYGYLVAAITLLLPAFLTATQDAQEPLERLRSARRIECSWALATQTNWDGGRAATETQAGGMSASVFEFDPETETATIVSANGRSPVVRLVVGAVSFIESPRGGISLTTVFPWPDPRNSGAFIAVLSRHLDLSGPFPSQWHGSCQITG